MISDELHHEVRLDRCIDSKRPGLSLYPLSVHAFGAQITCTRSLKHEEGHKPPLKHRGTKLTGCLGSSAIMIVTSLPESPPFIGGRFYPAPSADVGQNAGKQGYG